MTTLAIQLYSLRNVSDLGDPLRLVQGAGIGAVEATSSNYDEAVRTAALCHDLGLAVPLGHLGLNWLRGDLVGILAIAQELGIATLILWGLPTDEMPATAGECSAEGAELGAFSSRLHAHGLRFAFQNHDWELAVHEDRFLGLDHLFAGAGSRLLWQGDLAWLARGSADVDAVGSADSDRLTSIHVKDLAPSGKALNEDGWADLGQSTLPWAAWWPAFAACTDQFVLEHDEPSDPARFLARVPASARALAAES